MTNGHDETSIPLQLLGASGLKLLMRSHHQDAKTMRLRRGSVALLIRGPSFCHALNFSFCKYMYLYYRLLPFSYAFVMTLTQCHIMVKFTVDTCLKYDIA